MTDQWQYQIRIYLGDEFAELARRNPHDPAIASLIQFDAFADYVAEAEKLGPENYPLYEWTKATIENPANKAKHVKSFALYVGGNEVYAKQVADALESDLQPMVGSDLITRMSKHSTNPADNPQPPGNASTPRDRRPGQLGALGFAPAQPPVMVAGGWS